MFFHRLFKRNTFESKKDINLSEIVSISRTCDRMLVSIEEYFRSEYSKQEGFKDHTDPLFIVTWLVSVLILLLNIIIIICAFMLYYRICTKLSHH